AAFRDVEREAACVVAARACARRGGKESAHVIKQSGIGGEVRARRATNGFLVRPHKPADRLAAGVDASFDRRFANQRARTISGLFPICAILGAAGDAKLRLHELHQCLAHETGLAGTGYTGYRGERTEWKTGLQAAEVVACDVTQFEPCMRLTRRARRRLERIAGQVTRRDRTFDAGKASWRSAVEHAPTTPAGLREIGRASCRARVEER